MTSEKPHFTFELCSHISFATSPLPSMIGNAKRLKQVGLSDSRYIQSCFQSSKMDRESEYKFEVGNRSTEHPRPNDPKKRYFYRQICLIIAAAIFLLWSPVRVNFKNFYHAPTPDEQVVSEPFSWNSVSILLLTSDQPTLTSFQILPSKRFQFYPCFATYQCARLSVPLDWSSHHPALNGKDVALATIAVIKRPALVEVTDPRYAGPILFNPGGPGNSGVRFLLQYGADFETLFDPEVPILTDNSLDKLGEDNKYFDLITFDPRGVNNSSPRPNCISDPLTRQIWNHDLSSIGSGIDDETVFGITWARLKAYGAICSSAAENSSTFSLDTGHPAQYVSSAQVANDMVAIIEQHGQWREERATIVMKKTAPGITSKEKTDIVAHTAYRAGEEKLQYWGFSYGSVLGQTFASIFPSKVGRMVLDGNVNADDYANLGWSTNLQDIDAITGNFSVMCFEAGAEKCSMYNKVGHEAIANTIRAMLKRLRWDPRWTVATDGSPIIITQTDITAAIFGNWYNAYYGFPIIDKLLHSLFVEDYATFVQQPTNNTCSTSAFKPYLDDFDPEAPSMAIRCTDGPSKSNMTRKEAQLHIKRLRAQSDLFGENWALVPLSCVGYTIRPMFRFEGPFGATSETLHHPILFANPELDPVTPLRNAVDAAADYAGSKVLEVQGAMGHCTLSMPSLEAFGIIRRYFSTGDLPTENLTRVRTSVRPWDVELKRPDNAGEQIWEAVGNFARGFPRSLHI